MCENDPASKEREPRRRRPRAKAIVIATTHFDDPRFSPKSAKQVTGTMKGLAAAAIAEKDLLQTRGW